MTPEQGTAFLKALGAPKVEKSGQWLRAPCPLAFALHQNHHDHNPSFGLTVRDDKKSSYNCFACGSGSALELLQKLEFYGSKKADFKLAREILDSEELAVVPLPAYGEFAKPEDLWVYHPWPESFLDDYPPVDHVDVAMAYLGSRGIPPEQATELDLRFDFIRSMVGFPFRDAYGQLAGMRGRSILPGVDGGKKHFDYTWKDHNNTKGVWYNETAFNLHGKVVVVEGQIDCAKVLQRYPKAVANLTAKPSDEKMIKLALTPGVILIPDNDATGAMTVKKYTEGLAKYKTPIDVIQLPSSVKDAGECHPDFLYGLIAQHL